MFQRKKGKGWFLGAEFYSTSPKVINRVKKKWMTKLLEWKESINLID